MTSAMIFLRLGPRAAAATGILLAAVGLARAAAAPGGDPSRDGGEAPTAVFIIDAATRSVRAEHRVPGRMADIPPS